MTKEIINTKQNEQRITLKNSRSLTLRERIAPLNMDFLNKILNLKSRKGYLLSHNTSALNAAMHIMEALVLKPVKFDQLDKEGRYIVSNPTFPPTTLSSEQAAYDCGVTIEDFLIGRAALEDGGLIEIPYEFLDDIKSEEIGCYVATEKIRKEPFTYSLSESQLPLYETSLVPTNIPYSKDFLKPYLYPNGKHSLLNSINHSTPMN